MRSKLEDIWKSNKEGIGKRNGKVSGKGIRGEVRGRCGGN